MPPLARVPSIPYYAPSSTLPCPLPTMDEIIHQSTSLRNSCRANVVAVGCHYIVKFGLGVRFEEGVNTMFVAQATRIPVPTIYAMYTVQSTNYIVMQRIQGDVVANVWHGLSEAEKVDVLDQMRDCFAELRNLLPPGYFGGVLRGPMATEAQWVDTLINTATSLRNGRNPPMAVIQPLIESASQGRPPVFTHGDLHSGNVMVQDNGTVVLIDWERSGWCPTYWERGIMLIGPGDPEDWSDGVGRILREFYGGNPFSAEAQSVGNIAFWMCDSSVDPER